MSTRLGRIAHVLAGGTVVVTALMAAVPAAAAGDASPSPEVSAPEASVTAPTPSDPPPESPSMPASPTPADATPSGEEGPAEEQGTGGGGVDRTARRAQTSGVDVVDDAFDPRQITVDAGAEVTWSNSGQNPHTVTADDGSFGSGTLQNGDTFSTTLQAPGSYPYYCELHGGPGGSGMSGVVVVRASGTGGGWTTTTGGAGDLPPTGRDLTMTVVAALVLVTAGVASLLLGRRAGGRAR
jgi:plastocyanin